MSSVRAAEISALLQLLTYFLEERHLLLHLQFYAQVKEYQTKSVGNIRAVFATFSNFLKVFSKTSLWSRSFVATRAKVGFLDELQFRGSICKDLQLGTFYDPCPGLHLWRWIPVSMGHDSMG